MRHETPLLLLVSFLVLFLHLSGAQICPRGHYATYYTSAPSFSGNLSPIYLSLIPKIAPTIRRDGAGNFYTLEMVRQGISGAVTLTKRSPANVKQWSVDAHFDHEETRENPDNYIPRHSSLEIDNNGNAYIAVMFPKDAAVFKHSDGTNSTLQGTPNSLNFFIAKFSATGAFQWALNFTSSYDAYPGSISITLSPNSDAFFIAGYAIAATVGDVSINSDNIFYAKGDAATGTVEWVKQISSYSSLNSPCTVYYDQFSNSVLLYFILRSSHIEFPGHPPMDLPLNPITEQYPYQPSVYRFNAQTGDYINFFFAKMDKFPSIVGLTELYSIKTDNEGNVYIAGFFEGKLTFSPSLSISSASQQSTYLAKFNSTGGVIWAKAFNGLNGDIPGEIFVVKSTGDIYITGMFKSRMVIDGVITRQRASSNAFYFAKLDTNGNLLSLLSNSSLTLQQYQDYLSYSVVADDAGNAYLYPAMFIVDGMKTAIVKFSPSCNACPKGTYLPITSLSAHHVSQCLPCPAGNYSASTGNYECQSCMKGANSGPVGATSAESCYQCPIAHYPTAVRHSEMQLSMTIPGNDQTGDVNHNLWVKAVDDDTIIIAGTFQATIQLDATTKLVSSGGTDFFIARISQATKASRTVTWVVHVGTVVDDIVTSLDYIDNKVFVGGSIGRNVTLNGFEFGIPEGATVFYAQLDAATGTVQSRYLTTTPPFFSERVTFIKAFPSFTLVGTYEFRGCNLMKFNHGTGVQEWMISFNDCGDSYIICSITDADIDEQGNLALSGTASLDICFRDRAGGAVKDKKYLETGGFVAIYSSAGNFTKSIQVGSELATMQLDSLKFLPSGEMIVGGTVGGSFSCGEAEFEVLDSDIFYAKYSIKGECKEAKVFNAEGLERLSKLVVDQSDSLIIVGVGSGVSVVDGMLKGYPIGTIDAFIMRYSLSSQKIAWIRQESMESSFYLKTVNSFDYSYNKGNDLGVFTWKKGANLTVSFLTSSCSSCPAGTYSTGVPTSVYDCIPCSEGTFSNVAGASSESMCQQCPAGFYAPVKGSTACTACPEGYFSSAKGAISESTCQLCNSATYSVNGSALCTPCPGGYFAGRGSSYCRPCSAGKFSPTGTDSDDSCQSCQNGWYAVNGSSICTPCSKGYSLAGPGVKPEDCTICRVGTYAPSAGSTFCANCPVGTYNSIAGSEECTQCAEGTFNPSTGSSTSSACQACPAGSYSTTKGAGTCTKCPKGTYSSTPGATDSSVCKDCPSGTYADETGLSSCKPCPRGSYNNHTRSDDISFCTPCSGALTTQNSHSASIDACFACPAGMYKYNNTNYESYCRVCAAGTFSATEGQIDCEPCEENYFSTSGQSRCLPCPFGYFSNASSSICAPCTLDTISTACPICTTNSSIVCMPTSAGLLALEYEDQAINSDPYFTKKEKFNATLIFAIVVLAFVALLIAVFIVMTIICCLAGRKQWLYSKLEGIISGEKFALQHKTDHWVPLMSKPSPFGCFMTVLFFIVSALVFMILLLDLIFADNNQNLSVIPLQTYSSLAKEKYGSDDEYQSGLRFDVQLYDYGSTNCSADISMFAITALEPYNVTFSTQGDYNQHCTVSVDIPKFRMEGDNQKFLVKFNDKYIQSTMLNVSVTIPHFMPLSTYTITETITAQPDVLFKGPVATNLKFILTKSIYSYPAPDAFIYGIFTSLFINNFRTSSIGYSAINQQTEKGSTIPSSLEGIQQKTGVAVQVSFALNPNAYYIVETPKMKLLDFISKVAAMAGAVGVVFGIIMSLLEGLLLKIPFFLPFVIYQRQPKEEAKPGLADQELKEATLNY